MQEAKGCFLQTSMHKNKKDLQLHIRYGFFKQSKTQEASENEASIAYQNHESKEYLIFCALTKTRLKCILGRCTCSYTFSKQHCKKKCTKYIQEANVSVICTNILRAKFRYNVISSIQAQSTIHFNNRTNFQDDQNVIYPIAK